MRKIFCVALVGISSLLLLGCGTEPVEHAKVTRTERSCFKANDCRFMVYTDGETFQITDTWTRHNSADIYGSIHEGHTYHFVVGGWRNPSTSTFRNILEVREEK